MLVKNKWKKKFKLSVPHSFVIIGAIIVFVSLLTYLVPAGQYERIEDVSTGRMIVNAELFQFIESTPIGFFDVFISIYHGFIEAADIIFFVLISYSMIYILVKCGALFGGVSILIKKLKGKERFIIPLFMILFSLASTTFGMWEEAYGLIPIFVGLAIALGYDGLVGGAIVLLSLGVGFASAISNPFSVGIAQSIAGVPLMSGMGYRIIIYIVFLTLSIWYLMRYAKMVKNNPEKSYVKDVKFSIVENMGDGELEFTKRHKYSLIVFGFTLVTLVIGATKFGWYLDELAALFLITTIVLGIINGMSAGEIADTFLEGAKEIMFGILIIGLSRVILVIMEDANIIDSIVYYLSSVLANVSVTTGALGILFIQNIFNFFVPSGTGQAVISMPIMSSLSDVIGLNRQIAVLAFQFGDGFSNLFWPTAVAVECGIMGVPINKWYKFITPLFGMMLVLEVIFIVIAVAINLGPF